MLNPPPLPGKSVPVMWLPTRTGVIGGEKSGCLVMLCCVLGSRSQPLHLSLAVQARKRFWPAGAAQCMHALHISAIYKMEPRSTYLPYVSYQSIAVAMLRVLLNVKLPRDFDLMAPAIYAISAQSRKHK